MNQHDITLRIKEIRPAAEGYAISEGIFEEPFSDKKVVLRPKDGGYEPLAIVGRHYVVIPNELVLDVVSDAFREAGLPFDLSEIPRISRTSGRIDLQAELGYKYSGSVLYMDDRKLRLDITFPDLGLNKEVKVGDVIQYGISIRNAIDATSAFAMDAYSFRLGCLNGATYRESEFSIYFRHRGSVKSLRERMSEDLRYAIKRMPEWVQHLHKLYVRLSGVPLNKEQAEALLELNFPDMYYEDLLKLDVKEEVRKVGGVEKIVWVTTVKDFKQGITLWDAFNHFTKIITHHSRASVLQRSQMTHRLHTLMEWLVR